MTFWSAYLGVVGPLVVVMGCAMWAPRWWQWAGLAAGPLVTVLAAADVAWVQPLGWLATVGVGYAFLLVPPLLPWRRPWARWTMPATVLLLCSILAAAAGFDAVTLFFLGLPALLSLGVLVVLLVLTRADRRRRTSG